MSSNVDTDYPDKMDLIEKLKCKDENAFRQFVNNNQKYVMNICYRFVYNKELAEDITQEVFIEVIKSIHFFRKEAKISTWLYRIAISKSLDYIKFHRRKKRIAFFKNLMPFNETAENTLYNKNDLPDRNIENNDKMYAIKTALDKLPEKQRIAFSLSKYDDLSSKEISEIMELSISAVEALIHRAKNNLHKLLFDYYKKQL